MIYLLSLGICQTNYTEIVKNLKNAMVSDQFKGSSYNRLAYLVDSYGPRVWGSKQLQLVIDQLYNMATKDGFQNIRKQPVTNLTYWIRNSQQLIMLSPRRNFKLDLSALGYSVSGDVTAQLIVLSGFQQLQKRKTQVKGKIVCFNFQWSVYRQLYGMRINGASKVAQYGGVGFLVKSIASKSIYSVHTGYMKYDNNFPKIPAAAITVQDAQMFNRMQNRGQKIILRLNISTSFQIGHNSSNLIFEIKGSTMPQNILLLGGHIDSWDTGSQTGSNDDGGGVITCYQAVRLLLKNGLRPKRTIRFIAWSGEQSGQSNKGAFQYVQSHINQIDNHIVAFQSDLGSTKLIGFGLSGKGLDILYKVVSNYLLQINVTTVTNDGDAVDTTPLYQKGVPQMKNLIQDTPSHDYYFTFHHSAGDSMTIMNTNDMDSNVLGIASLFYILADLDQSLR